MTNLVGVIVTAVDTDPQFALGTIYTNYDGKKYKYVKLRNETATVAGVAGDVAAYLGSPSDGDEDNTVVLDNTDAATKPVGAGVIGAAVAGVLATAYYLWVQVTGEFTAAENLAGTPADGDALFLSTTDKTLTLATAADDPVT
jgi:hypothetical protein